MRKTIFGTLIELVRGGQGIFTGNNQGPLDKASQGKIDAEMGPIINDKSFKPQFNSEKQQGYFLNNLQAVLALKTHAECKDTIPGLQVSAQILPGKEMDEQPKMPLVASDPLKIKPSDFTLPNGSDLESEIRSLCRGKNIQIERNLAAIDLISVSVALPGCNIATDVECAKVTKQNYSPVYFLPNEKYFNREVECPKKYGASLVYADNQTLTDCLILTRGVFACVGGSQNPRTLTAIEIPNSTVSKIIKSDEDMAEAMMEPGCIAIFIEWDIKSNQARNAYRPAQTMASQSVESPLISGERLEVKCSGAQAGPKMIRSRDNPESASSQTKNHEGQSMVSATLVGGSVKETRAPIVMTEDRIFLRATVFAIAPIVVNTRGVEASKLDRDQLIKGMQKRADDVKKNYESKFEEEHNNNAPRNRF